MDKLDFSNMNDIQLKHREYMLLHQVHLLEEACDAVITTDVEFTIVNWNKGAEHIYGWTASQAQGMNLKTLFQLDFININEEELMYRLLRGETVETNDIHTCQDGSRINVLGKISLMDQILIEVKDTGIGIPSDKLDIIFERFGQADNNFSRQNEGSGIGLSFVKAIVQALGGSISVKSEIGKGTTFSIWLPDETVNDEQIEMTIMESMKESRLIESAKIEFSDIYL